MSFIWSYQAMEFLLDHPLEDVREWAISRIFDLYPETAEQLLAHVPSASNESAIRILDRLAQLKPAISQPDPLFETFQTSKQDEVKALSAVLLLRSGHNLPPGGIGLISSSPYVWLLAATVPGFEHTLRLYREQSNDNLPVLAAIATACGFDDLFINILRAEPAGKLATVRKRLEKPWQTSIPSLEKLSKPEQLLPVLDQSLAAAIPPHDTPWKKNLVTELEEDRQRLATVRDIARERQTRWSAQEAGFIRACILCLRRNEVCHRRLIEAKDTAGLWPALVMKVWRGVPSPDLVELVRSSDQELIDSLETALAVSYAYGAYPFAILNELSLPRRFSIFLRVLHDEKYGVILAEEASVALKQAGIPAAEYIMEHYAGMSPLQQTLSFNVLSAIPTPEVVDFFLQHFEERLRDDESPEFVASLERIASREFLPPLLREWRTGEVRMSRAIKLIAEVNNLKDRAIEDAIREIPEKEKSLEAVFKEPMKVFPFRCTSCGRTYHYELRRIYISQDGGPYVGDIIQCKGCGTLGTCELTTMGHFGITAELARVISLREAKGKKANIGDSPVVLERLAEAKALGHQVKSASEGYLLMKNAIEKNPGDADLQRRMGNTLRNGGRPDLALPYFLEALRLNPKEADSYYMAADILIGQGKYREAIPYLERLVPLLRETKMDEKFRKDMFTAFMDHVVTIQQETGHQIELFPVRKWEGTRQSNDPGIFYLHSIDLSEPKGFDTLYQAFLHGRVPPKDLPPGRGGETEGLFERAKPLPFVKAVKEVGRNDPCPCGSGKKYKKCCGR